MSFLIIFWKMVFSAAMGCTVEKSHVAPLLEYPQFATVAITGHVEVKKGKKFFVTEKFWTEHLKRYQVDEDVECPTSVEVGKKYLYLSRIKIEKNNQSEKISEGTGLFYELPNAGFFIQKLEKMSQFDKSINPSWQHCSSDSDCISVKNKCNVNVGINVIYKKQFLDFVNQDQKIDCAKGPSKKQNTSKCAQNFCN